MAKSIMTNLEKHIYSIRKSYCTSFEDHKSYSIFNLLEDSTVEARVRRTLSFSLIPRHRLAWILRCKRSARGIAQLREANNPLLRPLMIEQTRRYARRRKKEEEEEAEEEEAEEEEEGKVVFGRRQSRLRASLAPRRRYGECSLALTRRGGRK
ncbi:hypothetical protein HZH68_011542 [Vespula germanica]|uniref:Uncharacterized protein n=1 Tax=Vespula germanica TaxID=30212 RepID=A0A834N1W7_VESGE|nr:hypothetical protein HZH68_011542 [Vespula germanica]